MLGTKEGNGKNVVVVGAVSALHSLTSSCNVLTYDGFRESLVVVQPISWHNLDTK